MGRFLILLYRRDKPLSYPEYSEESEQLSCKVVPSVVVKVTFGLQASYIED